MSTGAEKETISLSVTAHSPLTAIAARTNPTKVLPVSPRKMPPRVSEEDARVAFHVEVVGEKPHAASQHGDGDPPHGGLPRLVGHDPEKQGDDGGHPGRQTVHPVDEVHGVRDPHDPQHRQKRVHGEPPGRLVGEEVEEDPLADHDRHDQELDEEFPAGRDVAPVVDDADDRHDDAPRKHDEHLVIEDHVGEQRGVEGQDDRQPAQQRRAAPVNLPPPRDIHDVEPRGDPHDERGECPRKAARQQQDVEPAFADLEEIHAEMRDDEQARDGRRHGPEDPPREVLPERSAQHARLACPRVPASCPRPVQCFGSASRSAFRMVSISAPVSAGYSGIDTARRQARSEVSYPGSRR